MSSNFVKAGACFRAMLPGPDGDGCPDVQVHFILYLMGCKGRAITTGARYFADVCMCRPRTRGKLQLAR